MATGRGIEFGTRSYKAAVVERGARGAVVKGLSLDERPLAAQGPAGEDPAWVEKLNPCAGGNTVLGIGARDQIVRYSRFPVVPPWRLKMMAEYEMEEAGRSAGMEVVGDFASVYPPGGPSEGTTVMSVLARQETVSEGFGKAKEGGFKAVYAAPAAVALFYAYRESTLLSRDDITLLVDVGYESSSVAIAGPGGLFFARNVNDGLFRLVKAIDGALGVGLERAEAFLRDRLDLGGRVPEDASAQYKNAYQVALSGLSQLTSTIAGTLRFAQGQLKLRQLEVKRAVVSGGGCMLPGVVQMLGRSLNMQPTIFRIGDHIPVSSAVPTNLAGPLMVVPVGLALAAADAEPIMAIVPPEVAARQEFWRRKVYYYLAPAAAALLVGVAAAAGGMQARAATATVSKIEGEVRAAEMELEEVKRLTGELDGKYRLYDVMRRMAAPAALLNEVVQVLHTAAPDDLKYTSLQTEGSGALGVIRVNVEGVSSNEDPEETLQKLDQLTRAIKGLGFVEDATSTTVEDKNRKAIGIPFDISVKVRFAAPPEDEAGPAEGGAEE
ncbi:MAG: hypothetical protein JW909_02805 [Planctomycetes bacterium]|nr:hypothetical protein [Planctomycetota bacterium]